MKTHAQLDSHQMPDREFAPYQRTTRYAHEPAAIPWVVHMRAYEVYRAVYGEQQALIEAGCRGGFGAGELFAFLYARSFPPEQWSQRVDEALRGMRP